MKIYKINDCIVVANSPKNALKKYKLLYINDCDKSKIKDIRKPKWWGSMFSSAVVKAMIKGELTYNNIDEWEKKYNGGITPRPSLGAKEIMDYYKSTGELPW